MILSNDGLVAFHYRSYGTFFLQQNRLHNIHRGFTHYKYYRAVFIINENLMRLILIFCFNESPQNMNILRYRDKGAWIHLFHNLFKFIKLCTCNDSD